MNLVEPEQDPSTAMAEPAEPLSTFRPWRYKQEMLLAFILLLASQAFVRTFGRIAQWEMEITGGKPLELPQPGHCKGDNEVSLNKFCQLDCCWYSSIIRSGY